MKVIIDSLLRLQDVPPKVLEQIKAELTIKNPDYILKKQLFPRMKWKWGQEYITLWTENVVDEVSTCILPRGFYARLWEIVQRFDLIDNTKVLPFIEFPSAPSLREYQEPAVQKAKAWTSGVCIMPCGAGKTETALGIVESIGQPTLWITHTKELLNQSMQRAYSRLGLTGNQIGLIQGKNMSIGTHMTFATVQTLAKKDLTDIVHKFGCIVIDECHQVFKDADKARTFESVISQFHAKYRFGITASEFRSDGLIDTMFHVIGPKFYEVDQNDPRLLTLKPRVEFIETNYFYEQEDDEIFRTTQMYADMRENSDRNNIIKTILKSTKESDYCLALGNSLEHLEELRDFVLANGKTAAFIHGKTKDGERKKIMSGVITGKYQYLFATYQLAKLGLDIPRLDKLFLLTPVKDQTSIQQAVGRVMRPMEGKKTPIVYDVWDKNIPQLVKWARERVRVYKSLGAEIVGGPKVRK